VAHKNHIIKCPHCGALTHLGAPKTGFLFSDPSFWTGAARLLDLGATFDAYNYSDSDEEADEKALYSDWAMVGSDMLASMSTYGRRSGEE
jgi:hypothetical protein